ncbi:DoxX family protein [Nocardia sp. NBC_00881]|uniref:DoxX family protein n=1 Tax=Nocardia sp. NBC_00881 TaxID=2975995 RepID=UPI0038686868|nr:DoxX family protein [Nocardia sp. NBC_00881]
MAPLVVLAVVTALARLIGRLAGIGWLDSWPHATALGLAAMFVLTSSAHFLRPRRDALIAMVPPRLSNPSALVTLTGILELAGAVGLVIPETADLAAICLIALLVVMFPANVRAARADLGIKTMPLPLRTLVQVLFLAALLVVLVS